MSEGGNPRHLQQDGNPHSSPSDMSDRENPSSSESEDSDTSDSSDDMSIDSPRANSPPAEADAEDSDSDSDVEEWTDNGWASVRRGRRFSGHASNISEMLLRLKSYASV